MDKEVLGQPVWLWAAGAVVVIGGYLYFRSHSSTASTSSSGTGQGGTGKDTSQSSFKETIKNWQSSPTTHKHRRAA